MGSCAAQGLTGTDVEPFVEVSLTESSDQAPLMRLQQITYALKVSPLACITHS